MLYKAAISASPWKLAHLANRSHQQFQALKSALNLGNSTTTAGPTNASSSSSSLGSQTTGGASGGAGGAKWHAGSRTFSYNHGKLANQPTSASSSSQETGRSDDEREECQQQRIDNLIWRSTGQQTVWRPIRPKSLLASTSQRQQSNAGDLAATDIQVSRLLHDRLRTVIHPDSAKSDTQTPRSALTELAQPTIIPGSSTRTPWPDMLAEPSRQQRRRNSTTAYANEDHPANELPPALTRRASTVGQRPRRRTAERRRSSSDLLSDTRLQMSTEQTRISAALARADDYEHPDPGSIEKICQSYMVDRAMYHPAIHERLLIAYSRLLPDKPAESISIFQSMLEYQLQPSYRAFAYAITAYIRAANLRRNVRTVLAKQLRLEANLVDSATLDARQAEYARLDHNDELESAFKLIEALAGHASNIQPHALEEVFCLACREDRLDIAYRALDIFGPGKAAPASKKLYAYLAAAQTRADDMAGADASRKAFDECQLVVSSHELVNPKTQNNRARLAHYEFELMHASLIDYHLRHGNLAEGLSRFDAALSSAAVAAVDRLQGASRMLAAITKTLVGDGKIDAAKQRVSQFNSFGLMSPSRDRTVRNYIVEQILTLPIQQHTLASLKYVFELYSYNVNTPEWDHGLVKHDTRFALAADVIAFSAAYALQDTTPRHERAEIMTLAMQLWQEVVIATARPTSAVILALVRDARQNSAVAILRALVLVPDSEQLLANVVSYWTAASTPEQVFAVISDATRALPYTASPSALAMLYDVVRASPDSSDIARNIAAVSAIHLHEHSSLGQREVALLLAAHLTALENDQSIDTASIATNLLASQDALQITLSAESLKRDLSDPVARAGILSGISKTLDGSSTIAVSSSPSTGSPTSTLPSSVGTVAAPSLAERRELPPPAHADCRSSRMRLIRAADAPPPNRDLSNRIGDLCRIRQSLSALRVYETALARGQLPYVQTMTELIDSLGAGASRYKVADMPLRELYLQTYELLSDVTLPHQTMIELWQSLESGMIIALASTGHIDDAILHRDRLYREGLRPSADAYALLIQHAHSTTDDARVALAIFEEAKAAGCVPNAFLYNNVISKSAKAKRIGVASRLLEEMKAAGLRPTHVTYGSLIAGKLRAGDEEGALELYDEMTSLSHYKAAVPPLNSLMQHFIGKSDRQRAVQYLDCLLNARLRPTAHTYRLMIDIHAGLQPFDNQAALRIFDELCAPGGYGVQPIHWTALIRGYGIAQNDLDKAVETFESIASHPSLGRRRVADVRDELVYETLFEVLQAHQRYDLVERFAQMMRSEGVPVTAYIANKLIKLYASAGQIAQARAVFEGLCDPPTGVAGHPNRSAEARPAQTSTTFREPSTYQAAVRAELEAGERSRAVEMVELARQRGYPPLVFQAIADELEQ
ncbi:uncharacterized protein L969DRAFT_91059 [Mixia osmundae IAM 14324]|uniref:Pentacotripeptide-repeat region of PRORP domain-containing protein n=1 Tax=Mixia osmundae (strain CBS 9802 / IAM 14324 / JCM 22182 / KY 12970) TaxID=764103 RepID=G7DUI9_MIXOS|nr:uncharacterized protein L969DRAFT_91059 [Mixia osmundae IAM 14324]KEI36416.1 hypothetical protein L969DRAFT_91059 [Mixia osmundae IAM 14324]GAA94249.1 hypothetical protein E5Q_00898 [Mixia osmundae IAM 14324]